METPKDSQWQGESNGEYFEGCWEIYSGEIYMLKILENPVLNKNLLKVLRENLPRRIDNYNVVQWLYENDVKILIHVQPDQLFDWNHNPLPPFLFTNDIQEIKFQTYWFYEYSWLLPHIHKARIEIYWIDVACDHMNHVIYWKAFKHRSSMSFYAFQIEILNNYGIHAAMSFRPEYHAP